MSKLAHIKEIEKKYSQKTYETNVDFTKPKFFACFPYPYMNGKLHLGHAYTMLKVDYEARFKKINGYNVLFPFGFHVTGIPIYAASMKLKKELETNNKSYQYNIMKSFNIKEEDIPKFVDPLEWVKYFPNMGLDHISKLNIMVDKRRSFVTTEINPFYDSFVRWQFIKLYEKKYLKFGTRNSIYSDSLQMQCQDHDRSVGEGIQNSNFMIHEVTICCENENCVLWVLYSPMEKEKYYYALYVYISTKNKFNKYYSKDENKYIYMTEYVYKNYSAQVKTLELISENISFSLDDFGYTTIIIEEHTNKYHEYLGGEVLGEINTEKINGEIIDVLGKDFSDILEKDKSYGKYKGIFVSMPDDIVIDRMGSMCIVKPVEQWYIDYANPEWKNIAHDCVNNMKLADQIKNGLTQSIDWLKEWGVSRTFGLGTKLPFDERFTIDSLSDSTLYPAYYTVSHFLHRDIYGKESDFDPKEFTNHVWDYIYLGVWNDSIKIERIKLDKMKESFNYFYPVDLRVSGKDLISNHLPMYIFNHCAIFDKKCLPITINCNGWILVNGVKMAKSNGNFITIENALEENSIDSVRLTLADSGDNLDDANYESKKAKDIYLLKIFNFVDGIEKISKCINEYSDEIHDVDTMFLNVFNKLFSQIIEHYKSYEYKNVVRDTFFVISNLREKYRIYTKYFNKTPNKDIMMHVIKLQLILLYPIISMISENLLDLFGINIDDINVQKINIIYDKNICDLYDSLENTILYIREKNDKNKKKNKPIMNCIVENSAFDEYLEKIMLEQLKINITFNKSENKEMKVRFI